MVPKEEKNIPCPFSPQDTAVYFFLEIFLKWLQLLNVVYFTFPDSSTVQKFHLK